MQAATYHRYGPADVIHIEDIPKPAPKKGEILVKLRASSVSTADWRLRASAFPAAFWLPGRVMFGLTAPRNPVLGREFSGQIVDTGSAVTRFIAGEQVFGSIPGGAHAEYLVVPEDAAVVEKPLSLSHEEAAAVPFGALTALAFLRDVARVGPGQKVLILGASGGVGVFAVQIARHLGAEVTAVASTANLELARSLDAHHVIDRTRANPLRGGARYDVVFDTVGATTFKAARQALAPHGLFVPLEFGLREVVQSLTGGLRRGPKVKIGVSGENRADLEAVADLLAKGILRPVIGSTLPFSRIKDAHREVEKRSKTGALVLTMDQPEDLRAAA